MSEQVDRLVEIISQLRAHCAWTAALTHESLVQYLLEESYELTEAIETHAPDAELEAELGDILLQVLLHASIGAERRAFDFDSIAAFLAAKMVRRNTHVFHPDGSLKDSFPDSIAEIIESWDRAKRAEKPLNESPTAGMPKNLPALLHAQTFLSRTARHSAITDAAPAPGADTRTNQDSVVPPDAPHRGVPEDEQELGEQLLALCDAARSRGLDAERALRNVVQQRIALAQGETQETTS
ncbi:MazG nucleotide pyrophosphohydrolase domain-containing protein [Paeniglutamicibacter psychrophenolicus]|uniref:MazG nucleotide pyrophosphohydrolase domain-containing protein n=1 Tax=Paeniglutamicibacter psychrophenolicus TaxID=257454 RepID=UPI00278985F0|nr:MazG nucleotide pyrophosphohydrolase domain-containing protein [Paeniglutamicibacter psychrophenolicus]MDQ0092578.1 XTP/dITP diphosphohydrolase [Paeniglutamicibacter psychrophenolicus]